MSYKYISILAKKGNLARVQRLVTPENINCRDSQGRIFVKARLLLLIVKLTKLPF